MVSCSSSTRGFCRGGVDLSSRMTLSVRLTEEQSNLVDVLRTEKKLSSYISLLLGALLQDRVSTTQFLLGLSDQSVAYNSLQESTIQANLYEKWLSLKLDVPFEDWVTTLRSAEIKHFGGLDMPKVDVKSALLDLLDDLGLELVEKGSTAQSSEDNPQVVSSTELGSSPSLSQEVNPHDLKDLVASMVHEILSNKSTNQGVEQPLSEAPTEPLVAVETIENTSTPQELENAPEGTTAPQNEVVEQEEEKVSQVEGKSSAVSSVEEELPTSEISPLVDTSALMSGFGE
jgi:hypothetical protein